MPLADAVVTDIAERTLQHLTLQLAATALVSRNFDLEAEDDIVKVPVFGARSQGTRTRTKGNPFVIDAEDNVTMVPVSADEIAYVSFGLDDASQVNADRSNFVENNAQLAAQELGEYVWGRLGGLFTVAAVGAAANLSKDFATLDRDDMINAALAAKGAKIRNPGVIWNTTAWGALLKDKAITDHNTLADENRMAEIEAMIQRRHGANHSFVEVLPDNSEQLGGLILSNDAAALGVVPYQVPERNNYVEVGRFDDEESGLSITLLVTHEGKGAETGYIFVLQHGVKLLDANRALRMVDTSI